MFEQLRDGIEGLGGRGGIGYICGRRPPPSSSSSCSTRKGCRTCSHPIDDDVRVERRLLKLLWLERKRRCEQTRVEAKTRKFTQEVRWRQLCRRRQHSFSLLHLLFLRRRHTRWQIRLRFEIGTIGIDPTRRYCRPSRPSTRKNINGSFALCFVWSIREGNTIILLWIMIVLAAYYSNTIYFQVLDHCKCFFFQKRKF